MTILWILIGIIFLLLIWFIIRIQTFRKRPFCRDCGADTIPAENEERVCPSCGWIDKKPPSMGK